jgi:hypothetical protein
MEQQISRLLESWSHQAHGWPNRLKSRVAPDHTTSLRRDETDKAKAGKMLLIGCSGERCILSALMAQHGKREAIPRAGRESLPWWGEQMQDCVGVTIVLGLHEQPKLKQNSLSARLYQIAGPRIGFQRHFLERHHHFSHHLTL